MPKSKDRVHREWFRSVMPKRKSCPNCGEKLLPGEQIWSWGEYVRAKWRTVQHFCKLCFPAIQQALQQHAGGCGCKFELVMYRGESQPEWLVLNSDLDSKEACSYESKRLETDAKQA